MRLIGRVFRTLMLLVIASASWLAGDRFGVPQAVREQVDVALGSAANSSRNTWMQSEVMIRERLAEAAHVDFDFHVPELPGVVRPEDLLVRTGADEDGAASIGPAAAAAPTAEVKVCRGMTVANAPSHDGDLLVEDLRARIDVNGVRLRTVPVSSGCISSGFGPRSGKLHRGVDFHHPTGSGVIAAAAGEIVEAGWRDDYGNYVIIDHGEGAFTRYAHLASFAAGVREGASVRDGAALGQMGNTAGYPMPIHLHYELLRGDCETPKKSFGLTGADPLSGRA